MAPLRRQGDGALHGVQIAAQAAVPRQGEALEVDVGGIQEGEKFPGKLTSLALDPIEKKPLRRFRPRSLILSVGSFIQFPGAYRREAGVPRPGGYGVLYDLPGHAGGGRPGGADAAPELSVGMEGNKIDIARQKGGISTQEKYTLGRFEVVRHT